MTNTMSDIQTEQSIMNLQNLQMEDSGPIQIDEQATDGNINEKIETDTEYSLPVSTSNANNEEPEV